MASIALTTDTSILTAVGIADNLWVMIIAVVLSIIVRLTDTHMSHPGILSLIFLLIFILPTLSMSVRRLHDTNRKGWWVLLALIPVVGPLTLIFFKASKGDTNSNRFGPAPLY